MKLNRRMRRALVALGMFALLSSSAMAASFTSVSGKIMNTASYKGDLYVIWSENGVTGNVDYSFTGTITSTCGSQTGTLYTATLPANSKGVIHQSIAIEAPCTNPVHVTYSDMQICDDINHVCAVIGNFSK